MSRIGRLPRLAVLQVAVSAILLGWLAFRVDWSVVAQAAFQLDWRWIAAIVALLLIADAVTALRWRHAARCVGTALPLRAALRIHYVGMYLNLFLPGTIGGDAWRVWKSAGIVGDAGAAARGVLAERIFLIFGLVLLVITRPDRGGRARGGHGSDRAGACA
jgi:uncharacterized protein (TIRG00374 family)